MTVDDYKTILCRQDDGSWVAEIPAISGCYALMPTREAALAELNRVFAMIAERMPRAIDVCRRTLPKSCMPAGRF